MSGLAGTGALVRLALRRDRLRLTVWVVTLAGIVAVLASAIGELYPDPASRRQLGASVAANPAFGALLGPLLDPLSVGGLVAWRASFLPMVLVPLMALQTMSRHTRAEEESGRLELLASTRIGHRAPLTAALVVTIGTSLVIGVLVTLALAGQGEALAGSIALGAVYAASGAMFAGIAAVTAQLTDTSRGASGLAGAVVGISFLVRGVADGTGETGPTWLRWLSPTGWTTEVRPYAGDRWWVLGLMLALVAATATTAYVLVERRDIGAGLLPTRPGPAEASAGLSSPLALAWRLHRGALVAWSVGMLSIGAVYGAVAESIGALVQDVPGAEAVLERLGGASLLVDAFLATTLGVLAMIVAVFTLSALSRARTEETSTRAEPLLATPVTRWRWLSAHVVVTVLGTAWLLAVAGFGEGLTHGLRVGDPGQAPRLAAAALTQLPPVLVLAGVGLALLGWAPRAVGAVWGVLVASLLLGQLGPVLQLDQWLLDLSPFTHAPRVPVHPFELAPVLALLAVAGGLGAAGFVGFRRRDIG